MIFGWGANRAGEDVSELKNATLKQEMAECIPAIADAHKDQDAQVAKVASAASTTAHDLEAATDALAASHKKQKTAIDAANAAVAKAT
jgi:hypothetical protein